VSVILNNILDIESKASVNDNPFMSKKTTD